MRNVPPAVLDDDPFWSVVRRRHPDVDVVLLPEPAPPAPSDPASSLTYEQVREVALLVGQTWASLAPLVRAAGCLDEGAPAAAPSVGWRGGDATFAALVIAKGLPGIGLAPGQELLRDIGTRLAEAGWPVDPHRGPRGESVLRARGPRVDVEAVAGPGATMVRIASGLLPTDDDVRRRVAQEVRSWV